MTALPPIVDQKTWPAELDKLRHAGEDRHPLLDSVAARRRRMPAVRLPGYTLQAEDGSGVTLPASSPEAPS